MEQQRTIIIQYNPKYSEQTVAMWRDSKEQVLLV